MKLNPFLNAILAALYIVFIVFIIENVASISENGNEPTLLVPMAMLGLFVLSAAVMSFLFIYEPLRLFLDNKKTEALAFFGKTVGVFAGLIAIFILYLFLF